MLTVIKVMEGDGAGPPELVPLTLRQCDSRNENASLCSSIYPFSLFTSFLSRNE